MSFASPLRRLTNRRLSRALLLGAFILPLCLPGVAAAREGSAYVSEANQERTSSGVAPLLSLSAAAESAADQRVRSMAATNDFSHDTTPLVLALEASGACYTGYGEIIAYNGKRDVAYTMNQWMASDGHRAIILKSSYDQAGGSWADSATPVNGSFRRYHVMYFVNSCDTSAPAPAPAPDPVAVQTADTTAPRLTYRDPKPDARGVYLNRAVTVVFSEPVTGVSSSTFRLRNRTTGTWVSGSVTYLSSTKVRLQPSRRLRAGHRYSAVLLSGIRDRAGNRFSPVGWQFATRY